MSGLSAADVAAAKGLGGGSYTGLGVGLHWYNHLDVRSGKFFTQLSLDISFDPAILLLGTCLHMSSLVLRGIYQENLLQHLRAKD